ncbi:MAG: hypothetical protein ACK4TR_08780 [Phenylobacterium sp.]
MYIVIDATGREAALPAYTCPVAAQAAAADLSRALRQAFGVIRL